MQEKRIINLSNLLSIVDECDAYFVAYFVDIKNEEDYNSVIDFFYDSNCMANYCEYKQGKQIFFVTDRSIKNHDAMSVVNKMLDGVKEILSK